MWLHVFLFLLFVYCLYWGVKSSRGSKTAYDFFLASRQIPAWVFVLTGTALSLSGWIFTGFPSMVFLDGFQFAQCALGVVVIPLAGILFLKRQWMLAKGYSYVTPGEMLADYFEGESICVVVVIIALVFAIPFVGIQLTAAGQLISSLTDGKVGPYAAIWILSFNTFLYVCIGGMRAVTSVGALQSMLMVGGMVAISCVAYIQLGSLVTLTEALARLGASNDSSAVNYFMIPGVIQFTKGIGKEMPVGGIWTTSMILTYCFALMGIQASPSFSMLGFSSRDPRGFAAQQVWALGGVIGIILLFFAIAQGMGAHFLGATKGITSAGLALSGVLPKQETGKYVNLSAVYIKSIAVENPWFMALLAICALSAVQVAASVYASTTATIFTIDIYKRFMRPAAHGRELKLCARIALMVIFLIAVVMATFTPVAQAQLGMLALSFAVQLWPALAGICWFPWITRQGAVLGLIAGLVAVTLTDPVGGSITLFFGLDLPWGYWPWTIYSAGWGLFCNFLICGVVSLATHGGESRLHRLTYHRFLQEHEGPPKRKSIMRPTLWALTLAWLFFAIGPGALIGNDFFGAPNGGPAAWKIGMPSLWGWQIIWWALGILVIWWLAYKMELSLLPRKQVAEMCRESRTGLRVVRRTPLWIKNFLDRIT